MYCCLTREPSFWRSRLKEIRSEATVAEKSFTGMATNPNEMVSEAMERAWDGMGRSLSVAAQRRQLNGARKKCGKSLKYQE
jgi:hypothetical protein